MTSLMTEALRTRIGEEVTYVAPEAIGLAAGRYFALAIGDENPIYSTGIVPPTWLFETNTYTGLARDEDGFAGHSWHLDVPDARLVRGGHRYRWHRDVRAEDVITATWSLVDMAERTTRTGAPMLVVTSRCNYADQVGEIIAEQTEDLVFVGLA